MRLQWLIIALLTSGLMWTMIVRTAADIYHVDKSRIITYGHLGRPVLRNVL